MMSDSHQQISKMEMTVSSASSPPSAKSTGQNDEGASQTARKDQTEKEIGNVSKGDTADDTPMKEGEGNEPSNAKLDEGAAKNRGKEQKRKKRGMKPRSQRNRKRPRGGGVQGLGHFGDDTSNEDAENVEGKVEVEIIHLSDATRLLSEKVKMDRVAWAGKRVRIVRPYPFTFATFAKARWLGRPILDVYHEEFGSYPKSYYESAINEGRILVSGKHVSCDYKIKGGDELTHTVHRHEPAVAVSDEVSLSSLTIKSTSTQKGQEVKMSPLIKVMYEDDDVIVVDKPATLPIHPCGGYNFNSLFHILAKQDPALRGRLHTVHRLDRLTSGVTVVAKSTHVAKSLGKCITDRDHCHKTYVARVKGKFPLGIPEKLSRLSAICTKEDGEGRSDSPKQEQPPCQHGEQVDPQTSSTIVSSGKKNCKRDTKAGLGFWVTDGFGVIHNNASASDIFDARQDIQNLLQQEESLDHQQSDMIADKKCEKALDNSDYGKQRWIHLACPCRVASHKNGICEAGDFSHLSTSEATDKKFGIKPAQTSFAVVGYDAKTDSTIVLARPVTGRTHQIRLHLQYLGHPIANDPNYGGDLWYGDPKGAAACQDARGEMDKLDQMQCGENRQAQDSLCESEAKRGKSTSFVPPPKDATSTDVPATEEEVQNAALQVREEGESLLSFIKKTCVWCARSRGGDRVLFEFLVRSRGIWLHAIKYKMKGGNGEMITYRTDPPSWSCLNEGTK